jgi:hypothetical protein
MKLKIIIQIKEDRVSKFRALISQNLKYFNYLTFKDLFHRIRNDNFTLLEC